MLAVVPLALEAFTVSLDVTVPSFLISVTVLPSLFTPSEATVLLVTVSVTVPVDGSRVTVVLVLVVLSTVVPSVLVVTDVAADRLELALTVCVIFSASGPLMLTSR